MELMIGILVMMLIFIVIKTSIHAVIKIGICIALISMLIGFIS